ncbi:uncharacterized protein LOC105631559 isoform X2 [Jatropha curcas]|uniref:uncharacterized protein LOC105631559 isoform X2 n=1 Tax=Jatropha curcas TaxID=180498 RepID=UPI0005FAB3F3|nr:uncharacterized protein LOC105631559 isoform X2 [Jatropha curcas]
MKESDKNIIRGDGLQFTFYVYVSKVFVSSSSSMAKLCCPIELEPKTLKEDQLIHAREVAADVVQKMEPEEAQASTIFIKGMTAVVSIKEMDNIEENGYGEDDKRLAADCNKESSEIIDSPCQCSVISTSTTNLEFPEQIKEPLSAPF